MIRINIEKAKLIAHDQRRLARASEFAPLDVEVTIPAKAVEAEQKRQEVRERYSSYQTAIDEAQTVDELKQTMALWTP